MEKLRAGLAVLQAGKYMRAVMSEMPRRNGWTVAEHVRDRTPDKTQRLLSRASWDALATMAEVRRFAVAGLTEAAQKGARRRRHLVTPGRSRFAWASSYCAPSR
jgi:hypothetical protein